MIVESCWLWIVRCGSPQRCPSVVIVSPQDSPQQNAQYDAPFQGASLSMPPMFFAVPPSLKHIREKETSTIQLFLTPLSLSLVLTLQRGIAERGTCCCCCCCCVRCRPRRRRYGYGSWHHPDGLGKEVVRKPGTVCRRRTQRSRFVVERRLFRGTAPTVCLGSSNRRLALWVLCASFSLAAQKLDPGQWYGHPQQLECSFAGGYSRKLASQ